MFGVTTRQTRVTSKSKLGIQSFYGSNKSTDFHSTQRILGKFKELPRHPYLTEYVYATSTPLQQMILVQSLFTDRLIDAEPLKEYIVQMVVALSYLNDLGIVCGTLSESTVFLSENTIKISNWGLFHMVHGGNVDFPVIHPRYLSPESHVGIYYKQDVWSLGILLLDWVLKRDLNGMAIDGFFDKEELHAVPEQGIPPLLRDFILDCLNPDHKNRPQIQGLLLHPFLEDVVFPELWKKSPFIAPKQDLSLETFMPTHGQLLELWKLLGNDLEKECKSSSNKPAIFTIPTVVKTSDEVQQLVSQLQGRPPFDDQLKQINLEPVFDRIHLIKTDSKMFDSILATYNDEWKRQIEWKLENIEAIWENYALKPSQLYAVEKERDFNYQFARWYQFAELLQRFPHSLALIRKEASVDIPPILRGLIWGALLEIKGDPRIDYEMYSTEAEHPTDRQLDLDIPRCHQYIPLLATPQGHQKLKRILKAWVNAEVDQVYWQGLDSLCACFLSLNFNDEAMAFVSMRAFIHKFCKGFFGMENAKLMRQHMQSLWHLLSFHDPELAWHLNTIGIGPELYALSWFMTLFAHVFPLSKIYYLWDHYLTGPPLLFMFTAVSILQQLRDQLLASDFTNAMIVFSELSQVSLETCIIDSLRAVKVTPPSILDRLKNFVNEPYDTTKENARFSFLAGKTSIVPHISHADFFIIKPMSVIIDTRPIDLFKNGHVPGSICVVESSFTAPDSISFGFKIMLQRSNYTILITDAEISEFAYYLLQQKQSRVCLIDGGILETFEMTELCICKPGFFGNGYQYKCANK